MDKISCIENCFQKNEKKFLSNIEIRKWVEIWIFGVWQTQLKICLQHRCFDIIHSFYQKMIYGCYFDYKTYIIWWLSETKLLPEDVYIVFPTTLDLFPCSTSVLRFDHWFFVLQIRQQFMRSISVYADYFRIPFLSVCVRIIEAYIWPSQQYFSNCRFNIHQQTKYYVVFHVK